MSSRPVAPALPRAVIALALTSFFTDVGTEMIFPLLPAFLVTLGAAPTFLGLVEGVSDATSSLLKLYVGARADRMRRKKPIVMLGYGLATFVRPLVGFATAPWHVLVVRVSDRVGKGIRSSPRDVLIAAAVSKENAGRAFGVHQAFDHAGALVGPLVASGLLWLGLSVRHVFWVAIIPGLLALGALSLVRERDVADRAPKAPSEPEPTRLSPTLKRYLGIVALFCIANSSDAFLLLRARDLGVSVPLVPVIWAFFHLSKSASAYLGGGWSDRVPRHYVIIAGWAVYAVAYAGFALATEAWQMWALFLLYGAYQGLAEPAEKALVKELAPPHGMGRAYGAYNFIVGISAVPAGLTMGFLWEHFGAATGLALGAAVSALASAALLVWARTAPPRAA